MTSSSENQNINPFSFLEIGITLTFADILNLEQSMRFMTHEL